MFEFNGYLSGEAEKFSLKMSRKTVFFAFSFVFLVLFLLILIVSINTKIWSILISYVLVVIFLETWILCGPVLRSKKQKKIDAYRRIFDDGEYIVCQLKSDSHEIYDLASDVSSVFDYDTFYYISFNGKPNEHFVCQKDLMIKGTQEAFEALFEGKIIKKSEK